MNSTQAVWKLSLLATLVTILILTPANAAVQINDTTNIGLSVFIPCAAGGSGEIVVLAGPLHTLVSSTINGNNVSGYFHFQPKGIVGVGATTGDKFQATGVTEQSFKIAFHNGEANLTSVNNFRIIGQGSGNNFLVHETLHITINADGSENVFHDNFNASCQ